MANRDLSKPLEDSYLKRGGLVAAGAAVTVAGAGLGISMLRQAY